MSNLGIRSLGRTTKQKVKLFLKIGYTMCIIWCSIPECKANWPTCAGFRLPQGCCNVASSHKITPKLYTSDFSFDGSSRSTSGAIHSGYKWHKRSFLLDNEIKMVKKVSEDYMRATKLTVPAADLDERNVFAFKRERPKSQTWLRQCRIKELKKGTIENKEGHLI